MARKGSKPSAAPKTAVKQNRPPLTRTREEPGATNTNDGANISTDLEQKCLDIFRETLGPSSDDSSILQEVKRHLFNRNFAAAFGQEEYLRVYASRWSPSRALAYLNVFADLDTPLKCSYDGKDVDQAITHMRAVCLGGGAGGELVGLGGWLSTLSSAAADVAERKLRIDLVDIADWRTVVQLLQAGLTSPPELSKYASQAKKDANKALVSALAIDACFHELDVLSPETAKQDQLTRLLEEADLVTFMFTLNELYSTSLPATQALLDKVTDTVKVESHLLVVDSPGSYSTVSLNGVEKKYPMQWLLDHTLLSPKAGGGSKWEKVVEDNSRWFRLSKELSYPITLEDMRFQMHLFRRVS